MGSASDHGSESRVKLILAGAVCLIGLSLAVWTFWPTGRNTTSVPPVAALADAVALKASSPEPANPAWLLHGAEASATIERAMDDPELGSLGLTPAEKRRIAQLATERLRLFVAPSRESYLAHLNSVLGPEAAASVSDEQIENYLGKASGFADAPVDPDGIVVRPQYVAGVLVNSLSRGGGSTYNRGHQPYTDIADPEDEEADVVDVLVPMIVSSPIEPYTEGKVYLVLSFVRDPELDDWRPWRHSVYDPANRIRVLPSPWM